MNNLQRLHAEFGQSPWLDNLRRGWLTGGQLADWVDAGIRGVTSNPTIFQKAMQAGDDYDEQLADLVAGGVDIEAAYWGLVESDIGTALQVLRPVHDASDGEDGYVSVELAPDLARDTEGSIVAARALGDRIAGANLYLKIPGTAEGIPAVRQMVAEGRDINVTLIFSLERYEEVIEAYLSGLEARDGDLTRVTGVASFFVSRVDTEVDRRLSEIGSPEALALRGRAAVAQARVAYDIFTDRFAGPRWDALAARGARVQRPLWASTSTKNDAYSDVLYVDSLIGPRSVNTLPDATIDAFLDHGTLARTIDVDADEARGVLEAIGAVGVDLDDVGRVLEDQGVASFAASFDEVLETLAGRAADLGAG